VGVPVGRVPAAVDLNAGDGWGNSLLQPLDVETALGLAVLLGLLHRILLVEIDVLVTGTATERRTTCRCSDSSPASRSGCSGPAGRGRRGSALRWPARCARRCPAACCPPGSPARSPGRSAPRASEC